MNVKREGFYRSHAQEIFQERQLLPWSHAATSSCYIFCIAFFFNEWQMCKLLIQVVVTPIGQRSACKPVRERCTYALDIVNCTGRLAERYHTTYPKAFNVSVRHNINITHFFLKCLLLETCIFLFESRVKRSSGFANNRDNIASRLHYDN